MFPMSIRAYEPAECGISIQAARLVNRSLCQRLLITGMSTDQVINISPNYATALNSSSTAALNVYQRGAAIVSWPAG